MGSINDWSKARGQGMHPETDKNTQPGYKQPDPRQEQGPTQDTGFEQPAPPVKNERPWIRKNWKKIFFIFAALVMFGTVGYLVFKHGWKGTFTNGQVFDVFGPKQEFSIEMNADQMQEYIELQGQYEALKAQYLSNKYAIKKFMETPLQPGESRKMKIITEGCSAASLPPIQKTIY